MKIFTNSIQLFKYGKISSLKVPYCRIKIPLCLLLCLFTCIQSVFATADYVYHEASTNSLGCGTDNYRSVLTPTPCQAVKLAFQVKYQNYTDQTRVYYTTDGSTPAGNKGTASGTSTAVTGAWSCTYSDGGVVDVWTVSIPAQVSGTVVKYVIGAWHTGGGNEVFANGGDDGTADVYTYTVTPTTYYVNDASTTGDRWCSAIGNDANNGTSISTPKLTLADVLNDYDLCPGDVVRIEHGTYSWTGISWATAAYQNDYGSSAGVLTIEGAGSSGSYITNITSSSGVLFNFPNSSDTYDYITFKDMKLTGASGSSIFYFGQNDYCTVQNNIITSVGGPTAVIHSFNAANNITISGNTISVGGTTTNGIYWEQGDVASTWTIEKNKFDGETGSEASRAIYAPTYVASVTIKNNYFSNFLVGIQQDQGTTGFTIYNNSFYCKNACIKAEMVVAAFNIQNNILQSYGTASTDYCMNFGGASGQFTCNYNLYKTASSNIVRWSNADYAAYANWHDATYNHDDNSVGGTDPGYTAVASGDLSFSSGSAGENIGVTGLVTDDILGSTRNNPPEMGAFEITTVTYATAQDGDWNTAATWVCNCAPPAAAAILINHVVTVNSAVTNATAAVTVAASKSITFGGGTLTVNSITNAGTLNATSGTLTVATAGTITNNSTASFAGGTVVFSGAGTIAGSVSTTFNNLTLNGTTTLTTAPTISGTLQMNNGSTVITNSPTYGASSTLSYTIDGGTTFTVGANSSLEWTGSATSVASGNPNNVTLTRANGAGTFTLQLPATTRGLAGNVLINANTILALSSTGGADLYIGGNFQNNGGFTGTGANARLVRFTSSSAQTISGSSTTSFGYLTSDNSHATGLSLSVNTTVANTLTVNASRYLSANATTITISSGGTFANNGTFTYGTSTVAFAGVGTVSGTTGFYNTTLAGAVNFGTASTINGTMTINTSGSVTTNAPSYASGSLLLYNTGGTIGLLGAWSATSGNGYPYNVQISNTTAMNPGSSGTGTARQIAGNLTIDASSALYMDFGADDMTQAITVLGNLVANGNVSLSNNAGGDLKVGGNFTRASTCTWANNGRAVEFNGSGTQTVTYTAGGTQNFDYFTINKSAGNVVIGASTDITMASSAGDNFTINNTGGLDLGGRTFTIIGGNIQLSSGSRSISNSTGTGTLAITTGNATMTGSGTLTLGTGVTLSLTTNLVIGANSLVLNGDLASTAGVFTGGTTSNLSIGGTGALTGSIKCTSLNNFTFNRTSSGTASLGSAIAIAGTLTLTAGIITTTDTNLPTITATTTGSISGGSASSYINGPISRTLPASLVSGSTYTFPVGKGGYNPFSLVDPLTGGTGPVIKAEVFDANSGGSVSGVLVSLNTNRYWSASVSSGNFTNSSIQLTDASVGAANEIGKCTTVNGTYSSIGGTVANPLITSTASTTALNFFTIGSIAVTTTAQAGDWNTAATWAGGVLPPAGSAVVIDHDVTVNSAVTNATGTLTVSAAKTLTFGGGTLTTNAVNISGTLTMTTGTLTIASGYTFTNSGTFNAGSGTIAFAGAGTIAGTSTFNNITLAGAVNFGTTSTITGNLTINSGGSVLTNAPTYTCPATLIINTTGTYSRATEWGAVTSGNGYPCNVQVSNSTTYDIGAGGAATTAQIAGNLTVDNSCIFTLDGGTKRTAAVKILGNVSVGGGASGTMTLSTSSGGDLEIGGNLTRGVGSTWTNNGRSVTFNGSGTQTISYTDGGLQYFDYCIINKSAGNLTLSSSPATNAQVQTASGDVFQILNTGGLDLNGQTFTLGCIGGCAGGNLLVSGGARTIISTIAGGVFRIQGASSSVLNKTVTSASGGTLAFSTNAILAINSCDLNPGSALTTINSEAHIESGGDFITNAPTYGSSSTLVFKTGSIFILTTGGGSQQAWVTGTSGAGVPYNVTIDGSSVAGSGIRMNANVAYTARGNLSITGNGTVDLSATNAPNNILNVAGNWTNTTSGTFSANTNKVKFNGGTAQTLTKTGGTETFYDIEIANTNGDLTLAASSAITLTHRLTFTSGNIVIGNNNFTYDLASIADAANTTQGTPGSTCKIVTNGTGVVTIKNLPAANSFVFQIGPTTTTYNRCYWETAGAGHTTDDLSARVEVGLPSDITNPNSFVNRTWFISEGVTGGSNGDINVYWITGDENADFTTNRSTGRLYHKPTTTWIIEPNTNLVALDNNSANMPATGWRSRSGAITSFSPFVEGTLTALPIELLKFTGQAVKAGNKLEWTTATEINNDYFTIERSKEGFDFSIAGIVKGAGNSTRKLDYEFLDNSADALQNEVSYYSLKQTDVDGKSTRSQVIAISRIKTAELSINSLFIDQENQVNLNLINGHKDPVSIEITDMLGRILISGNIKHQNGFTTLKLPENLARQVLLLIMYNDHERVIQRFIY